MKKSIIFLRISIIRRFPPVCDNFIYPRAESRPTREKSRKKNAPAIIAGAHNKNQKSETFFYGSIFSPLSILT